MEISYNHPNVPKIELPNSTAVLVLGIISIVACCCYGSGIILAIIALVLAKSATDLYVADPGKYTESSYKNLNTGKTCAWIALGVCILHLLSYVALIARFGLAVLTNPTSIYERLGIPF